MTTTELDAAVDTPPDEPLSYEPETYRDGPALPRRVPDAAPSIDAAKLKPRQPTV